MKATTTTKTTDNNVLVLHDMNVYSFEYFFTEDLIGSSLEIGEYLNLPSGESFTVYYPTGERVEIH